MGTMCAVELSEYHMWWKREGARGLRRVVMAEWDPIGVADVPEAQDEYDTYVGHLGRMLREGESEAAIRRYLGRVRHEYMGLPRSPRRDRHAARALTEWWAQQPPALGGHS
jgi:hypothetical protein